MLSGGILNEESYIVGMNGLVQWKDNPCIGIVVFGMLRGGICAFKRDLSLI